MTNLYKGSEALLQGKREFDILYALDMREEPTITSLLTGSHKYLFTIRADDMNDVFYKMQGHVWSPNGEAQGLIAGLGLTHTSMSINDVIVTRDDGVWIVKDIGFKQIICP